MTHHRPYRLNTPLWLTALVIATGLVVSGAQTTGATGVTGVSGAKASAGAAMAKDEGHECGWTAWLHLHDSRHARG